LDVTSSGARETSFVSEEAFTQETFRRWFERRSRSDSNHYELIDGHVVLSPPAAAWHEAVEARLVALLEAHASARGLGTVLASRTAYELPGGETLAPDVSFLSRERAQGGPRPERYEISRVVPSLVVEILSPATARRDRTEKLEIYVRNGVDEYWIVDFTRREITVHQPSDEGLTESVIYVSGVVESRVLPDLNARVEDVFGDVG